MTWKTIAFLILLILLTIFTYQNYDTIDIKFLKWGITDVPIIAVLISGLVFGFLLASILQLPRIIKLRRDLKRVIKELEASEKIIATNDEVVDSEGISMGSDYEGGFFNEKQ